MIINKSSINLFCERERFATQRQNLGVGRSIIFFGKKRKKVYRPNRKMVSYPYYTPFHRAFPFHSPTLALSVTHRRDDIPNPFGLQYCTVKKKKKVMHGSLFSSCGFFDRSRHTSFLGLHYKWPECVCSFIKNQTNDANRGTCPSSQ